jgi:murein DD-endopeptidase MepM/ murein hydrolase activator NlpD
MHIPLTNSAPRGASAPATAAPLPQGGGGTIVPFNAPNASSFEDTLRSLTQASTTNSQEGATAGARGVTFTPPAGTTAASSSGTTPAALGMSPSGAFPVVGGALSGAAGLAPTGSAGLAALLQALSIGSSAAPGGAGGMTAMELLLVPLQGGIGTSALGAGQGVTGTGAFQMPFQVPAPVTQPFGPTSYTAEPSYNGYSHFHTGIDYGVPMDTPIQAAGAGRVVAAGWDNTGFGNRVIIDHGNGTQTLYGHLNKVMARVGDTVQAGQQIGLSGTTGNSSGPHLHFGVQVNGQWVDPAPYLAGQGTSVDGLSTPSPLALGGGGLSTASLGAAASPGSIPLGLVLMPTASLTTGAVNASAFGGGTAGDAAAPLADPAIGGLITQAAQAAGLPSALVAAVVQTESGGNTQAVSPSGAKGLMQLMDGTATHYGVTNPFDPQQNLSAGSQYLAGLLRKYQGNEPLAVAAYNAGPSAVDRFGGIPPYPETQQYVQKVLALQQQYGGQG